MPNSAVGRVGSAGDCPTVAARVIFPAGVRIAAGISSPDDHFVAAPDGRVRVSGSGRVGEAGGCPTVGAGIVSAAGIQLEVASIPPHTIISRAGPHCGVSFPANGRVGGAGSCPTIGDRVVSPSGVQIGSSKPPQMIISLPVHTAV